MTRQGANDLALSTTTTTTSGTARKSRRHNDDYDDVKDEDNDQMSVSSRRGFLRTATATATAAVLWGNGGIGINDARSSSWAAEPLSTPATCDATVSVWQRGNRLIYLLGTAHISELSAALARQLVRDTHPSAVFVELDVRRVAGTTAATRSNNSLSSTADNKGIVSTQLDIDPGAASGGSRVVVPQVVPLSQRPGNAGVLPTSSLDDNGSATTAGSSSSSSLSTPTRTTTRPNWFRQSLTDWGAALVGKAIRSLYSNLGQAGFDPGT